MKLFFVGLLVLSLSQIAMADQICGKVIKIERGGVHGSSLVTFDNGQVINMPSGEGRTVAALASNLTLCVIPSKTLPDDMYLFSSISK